MPVSKLGLIEGADANALHRESEVPRKQGTSGPSIRSIGIGLLIASGAASPLAGAATLSVTEEIQVAAPPARTWAIVKDFGGWPAWHPAFKSTEIISGAGNAKGTVRVLTAQDGTRFTEELVSHDAGTRTYQYRITQSPLPIASYVSTLQVKEGSYGTSVVMWSSTFEVNPGSSAEEMKKTISGVYRTGLDNLAAVLKRDRQW